MVRFRAHTSSHPFDRPSRLGPVRELVASSNPPTNEALKERLRTGAVGERCCQARAIGADAAPRANHSDVAEEGRLDREPVEALAIRRVVNPLEAGELPEPHDGGQRRWGGAVVTHHLASRPARWTRSSARTVVT